MNPILEKFCEMIWNNFIQNDVQNFLDFFSIHVFLIILLWRTIFRNIKFTKNCNIFRQSILKKISTHRFEDLICWKDFFFFFKKIFFSMTWNFFHDCKTKHLGVFFGTKNQFYTFLQVWLFNFNAILKTSFQNSFTETEKKWWFYSFK